MSSKKNGIASRAFLLKEMVTRDVRVRYAGSSLGGLWAFGQPILWMLLYTAVFSVILRVPVERGFANFTEFLLAGLLPWMAIQEGISRSSSALTDNAPMVKKTVFPLETLVLSVVLSAAVNQVIAMGIFAIYVAAIGHLSLPWLLMAVPTLFLQLMLTFGLGCFVATATTFVRDVAHGISVLLTVVFYATPIVYPASLLPARYHWILTVNPVAHLVDWYRRAFTLHTAPEITSIFYVSLFAGLAALLGRALFARARPHFADLI
jgi:homopolymeric O-antigen transport system permease protein